MGVKGPLFPTQCQYGASSLGLIVCPQDPFGAETPGAKQTKALTQVFVEPNLVFAV